MGRMCLLSVYNRKQNPHSAGCTNDLRTVKLFGCEFNYNVYKFKKRHCILTLRIGTKEEYV